MEARGALPSACNEVVPIGASRRCVAVNRSSLFSVCLIALLAIYCGAGSTSAADKPIAKLEGPKARITSLAYSPDGKTLASASADKTIKLWGIAGSDFKERATLAGHGTAVADQ